MELLKQLYRIHSPSGEEDKMREFISKYVSEHVDDAEIQVDDYGNVYVTKGDSDTYPCVVAHIDQVQKEHAKDFDVIDDKGVLMGFSMKERSQQGLGADDKNGIWCAIKLLEKFDCVKAVFFVEEEIGCCGSRCAVPGFFEDCRFVIQADRKGNSDLIVNAWEPLCSKEFQDDCDYKLYGYKANHGMLTDVVELRTRGVELSMVNISCGYYCPHTDEEFTVKADLENCLAFMEHIFEKCTKQYNFEAVIEEDPYSMYDYWDYKGSINRNIGNKGVSQTIQIEPARHSWDSFFRDEILQLEELIKYELKKDPNTTVGDVFVEWSSYFSTLAYTDFLETFDRVRKSLGLNVVRQSSIPPKSINSKTADTPVVVKSTQIKDNDRKNTKQPPAQGAKCSGKKKYRHKK